LIFFLFIFYLLNAFLYWFLQNFFIILLLCFTLLQYIRASNDISIKSILSESFSTTHWIMDFFVHIFSSQISWYLSGNHYNYRLFDIISIALVFHWLFTLQINYSFHVMLKTHCFLLSFKLFQIIIMLFVFLLLPFYYFSIVECWNQLNGSCLPTAGIS